MDDTEKEIMELTDKCHTYKLKKDLTIFFKYSILAFSVSLIIILLTSVFL